MIVFYSIIYIIRYEVPSLHVLFTVTQSTLLVTIKMSGSTESTDRVKPLDIEGFVKILMRILATPVIEHNDDGVNDDECHDHIIPEPESQPESQPISESKTK